MSLRCGCWAEGDATVFGEVHECSKDPELRYTKRALPPLVPSWAFVVPPEPPCPVVHVELGERPWETVLSDDTEPGDLG